MITVTELAEGIALTDCVLRTAKRHNRVRLKGARKN